MIDRAFRPDPRAKLALLLLWAVAVFLSPGLWFEALRWACWGCTR